MVRSITVTSTGAGSKVVVEAAGASYGATPNQKAQWVSVASDPDNTGYIRHGDATVSATVGQKIAPGGGGGDPQYAAPSGLMGYGYILPEIYIYFEKAGDIANVNCLVR